MALLMTTLFLRGPSFAWSRLALAAFFFLAVGAVVNAAPTREYQVKAVFLFNFAQFVEWPATAFEGPDAPLVIGVVGNDPFDGALDEAVRGERVQGRSIVVTRFRRAQDVQKCHVLFVASSESGRVREIFDQVRDWNVLTVGDSDGFAMSGGIIRFLSNQGRIRLRINLDSARAAHLRLSSKLLRPAEIVGAEKE